MIQKNYDSGKNLMPLIINYSEREGNLGDLELLLKDQDMDFLNPKITKKIQNEKIDNLVEALYKNNTQKKSNHNFKNQKVQGIMIKLRKESKILISKETEKFKERHL